MLEAFSISCRSLDETQEDRHARSDDRVDSVGRTVVFQNPRTLGKGVDNFNELGVPQTPVMHMADPPTDQADASDLLLDPSSFAVMQDCGAGAGSVRGSAATQMAQSTKASHQLVLVRGGASFSGVYITLRLLQAGYNVRLLSKDCHAAASQLKDLVKERLPMAHTNRLFIFRGIELSEALVGCDYVICNAEPETGDLTSETDIEQRYLDDMQDLFLSIRRVCGIDSHVATSDSVSGGRHRTIRMVWITTAATLFPVETTSRDKERHLVSAKKLALREAERIAKKANIPFVVLLPSIMVGAALTDAKDEAHYMLSRIAQGNPWFPFAPKTFWNFVDVQDVAEAVVRAMTMEAPAHNQRYIVSETELSVCDIGRMLQARFPSLHPPKWPMPNAVTLLMCVVGFLGESVSLRYLRSNLSRQFRLSNQKARRDLRVKFHSAAEAIVSAVEQMQGLVAVPEAAGVGAPGGGGSLLSTSSSLSNVDSAKSATDMSSSSIPPRQPGVRARPTKRRNRHVLKTTVFMSCVAVASLAAGYIIGARN